MRIIYNGVDLGVLETYHFDVEPVFDDHGVDYLYSRVSVLVRALVNGVPGDITVPMSYNFTGSPSTVTNAKPDVSPAAGVAFLPGPAGAVPTLAAGSPLRGITRTPAIPAVTHEVVRHRLATPRGQLYIFAGPGMESGTPAAGLFTPPTGPLILRSPAGGNFLVDCKNGPFPKVWGINTALGDANLFIADFGVETFINEGPLNSVAPAGACLSNRFSQSHAVGEDGYTIIHTVGTAVYRTDLIGSGNPPDGDRAILFMPIPPGFTRVIEYVTGHPDGTGVDYAYTDTQVSVNFAAGPFVKAAKVSALHRQMINSNVDVIGGGLAAYERTLSILANKKFAAADDGMTAKDYARASFVDKLKSFKFK
jgi:hypothetical protein